MKSDFLLFFLIVVSLPGVCQEDIRDYRFDYYDSINFSTGYVLSTDDDRERNDLHLIDLGINFMSYGGRHGGGFQYGLGTEIGINTDSFTLGPKITGILYYTFIAIGSELVVYTDFNQTTLRYAPVLGIGGQRFRITINPQLIIFNKDFRPVKKIQVSFVYNFSLKREVLKRPDS